MGSFKGFIALLRPPNLFTSAADVAAGYIVVSGGGINFLELAALALSGVSIYGAGCALNDAVDQWRDAVRRPSRPIPSGQVPVHEAVALSAILFILGLLLASFSGLAGLAVSAVLVAFVMLYDLRLKDRPVLGPVSMGACRAFNLALGMSPALASTGFAALRYEIILLTFFYIFHVTRASMREGERPARDSSASWEALLSWAAVLAAAAYLLTWGAFLPESAAFALLFALATAGAKVILSRGDTSRAVAVMVLAVPFLDAFYASGAGGWEYGVLVAAASVPAAALSRLFHVS